jgi:hypothetical protein
MSSPAAAPRHRRRRRPFAVPAPIVAVVNWLVPGSGYLLIGQLARGLTIGFTILALFVMGMLIGGIHVVDPPVLSQAHGGNVMRAILEKPWYIGQFLAGAIGIISGWIGPSQPGSHARVNDIGTLYTAVAGMLNLLATIDSAYRATLIGERRDPQDQQDQQDQPPSTEQGDGQ